jgi:hypothetical protein
MPWNPNSQRAYLTKLWNALSPEEQQQVPLETFLEMGQKKQESGTADPTGDFGQYHVESSPLELVEGSAGGRIVGPVNQTWLGPENPLKLGNKNEAMGLGWSGWGGGNQVNFRRDVNPYMMYHNPEDPTMWDEMPHPATPLHHLPSWEEQDEWSAAARGDILQDRQRNQLKSGLKKKDLGLYTRMYQQGSLEEMLDALMQNIGGG